MQSKSITVTNSQGSPVQRIGVSVTFFVTVALTLSSFGCGACDIKPAIEDTTNRTLAVLDDGINSLENASADWQKVLQDMISKLTADAQSTIRNEISNTLHRAIAATGSQVLCIGDIVRNRIRQDLIRIKAKLLGGKLEDPEPWLCEVVPVAVDLSLDPDRRKIVEFFGYDLDTAPIQVTLVNGGGATDVSEQLSRQTHYHMSLNLGGSGVQLSPNSRKLIVKWKGEDQSTIPILQPQTPVCKVTTPPPIPLQNITFVPPHVKGDREFDGNGPNVNVAVELKNLGSRVEAVISMSARETKDDWTSAIGSQRSTIYTPDPGWRVEQIIGDVEDRFNYTDSNQNHDIFQRGSGGPVSSYDFVGDTDGDEAGLRTQVTVHFNRLRVVLRQTQDCVSPIIIAQLQQRQMISTSALNRFQPFLRTLPAELKTIAPRVSQ